MLLAIDIGNTNIKFGVFDKKKLVHQWKIQSNQSHSGKTLFQIYQKQNITGHISDCIIGSVVPHLTKPCSIFCSRYLKIKLLIVGPETRVPVTIGVNRRTLGADRLAEVVAAYTLYGKPAITIGLGTATTFNVINKQGAFIGGSIAVGLDAAVNALINSAALLPKFDVTAPSKVIATNTIENMQSGMLYGYIGLIEGMVKRIQDELGYKTQVIATGGAADLLAKHTNIFTQVNRNLIFEGLRIIWEYNHDSEK